MLAKHVLFTSSGFSAEGGTVTTSGLYTYHKFTANGCLDVTGKATIEYLLVGGGGSGGSDTKSRRDGGGGGGAGGYLCGSMEVGSGTYCVVVGPGGTVTTPPAKGNTGADSTWNGLCAYGGGGGGSGGDISGYNPGLDGIGKIGGSGGGGAACVSPATGGAACDNGAQGNCGGCRVGTNWSGAGGGGAGSVGCNTNGVWNHGCGGCGGCGCKWKDFPSSSCYYAGGGGGGGMTNNQAVSWNHFGNAIHGGGRGGGYCAFGCRIGTLPGETNTGGGGGGGSDETHGGNTCAPGGAGGSGVVIFRYLTP